MTERLDRIEALLLATAERQNEMNATLQQTQAVLNQTAQQQAVNTDEIDTLLGAVSSNEVGIRDLVTRIDESNRRFDILRAEAIADRQQAERKSEAWQANFDAQMQVMRSQLLEMSRINRRLDNLEQAS